MPQGNLSSTSLAPSSSASTAHTREDETKRISAGAATVVFCWPAAKHLYLQQDKGLQENGGDSDKYVYGEHPALPKSLSAVRTNGTDSLNMISRPLPMLECGAVSHKRYYIYAISWMSFQNLSVDLTESRLDVVNLEMSYGLEWQGLEMYRLRSVVTFGVVTFGVVVTRKVVTHKVV
jgi:hypothetical protein